MSRRDVGICLRGQEGEEVGVDLAILGLPRRRPVSPDGGECGERSGFVESEPHGNLLAIRSSLVVREGREWDEAAAFGPEPPPPMGRIPIARVGDARFGRPAFRRQDLRGHAPSAPTPLALGAGDPNDWRRIVGEMPGSVGRLPVRSWTTRNSARIADCTS